MLFHDAELSGADAFRQAFGKLCHGFFPKRANQLPKGSVKRCIGKIRPVHTVQQSFGKSVGYIAQRRVAVGVCGQIINKNGRNMR